MNITFEDSKKDVAVREDIIVAGRKVGWIEATERDGRTRYHAGINIPGAPTLFNLVQGHGDTKEEAIDELLKGAHRDGVRFQAALCAFEQELMGD